MAHVALAPDPIGLFRRIQCRHPFRNRLEPRQKKPALPNPANPGCDGSYGEAPPPPDQTPRNKGAIFLQRIPAATHVQNYAQLTRHRPGASQFQRVGHRINVNCRHFKRVTVRSRCQRRHLSATGTDRPADCNRSHKAARAVADCHIDDVLSARHICLHQHARHSAIYCNGLFAIAAVCHNLKQRRLRVGRNPRNGGSFIIPNRGCKHHRRRVLHAGRRTATQIKAHID